MVYTSNILSLYKNTASSHSFLYNFPPSPSSPSPHASSIPLRPTPPFATFSPLLPNPPLPPTAANTPLPHSYLHGGAFRDPAQSPSSILPSLPSIFGEGHHIRGVASLGYRLCEYPGHETDPWPPPGHDGGDGDGREGREGRGVRWPAMIEDVREGVRFLADGGDEGKRAREEGKRDGGGCMKGEEWVVVGHSVGATMAMMLAMSDPPPSRDEGKWGSKAREEGMGSVMARLKGVVGIEGVYDFVGLRDHHLEWRDVYEEFTTAAFGDEGMGGWRRGDLISNGEVVRGGVEVVVLGHSMQDELVEEGQSERMAGAVAVGGRYTHDGLVVRRVECKGGHDEVVEKGVELGRCVDVAVEALRERQSEGGKGGGR